MILSGSRLSIWAKVDTVKHINWIPNKFMGLSGGPVGFSVPPVGLMMQGKENIGIASPLQFVAIGQRDGFSTASTEGLIASLSVFDIDAAPIEVANLTQPITVALPTLVTPNADMRCVHWDKLHNRWSQQGIFISRTNLDSLNNHSNKTVIESESKMSTLTCSTTHLTSFLLDTGIMGSDAEAETYEDNIESALATRYPKQIEVVEAQLLFVFDTMNMSAIGLVLGMMAFHLILVAISASRQKNRRDDAYIHACKERFLNTGSTRWIGFRRHADKQSKLNASQFMISFAEKSLQFHPAIAWLQTATQLSFPRIFYALVFWIANSMLLFSSITIIGLTELERLENMPLSWIASSSSLAVIALINKAYSSILVWESVHLENQTMHGMSWLPTQLVPAGSSDAPTSSVI